METAARDVYQSISDRITTPSGRRFMLAMSEEEERHRKRLIDRFREIDGRELESAKNRVSPAPDADGGTSGDAVGAAAGRSANLPFDFSFVEKSVFSHTDAMEALKLCLGSEIDAISFYSRELSKAKNRRDARMLRWLVRFERKHKRKLERELTRFKKHY